MRVASGILGALFAVFATSAFAQVPNLSGTYRCVALCAPEAASNPAYVTQNGFDLNVLDEAGNASRAWIDWPGHIWVLNWQEGALFSPDGMTIQFDRGRIWQRGLEIIPEPAPPKAPRRKK